MKLRRAAAALAAAGLAFVLGGGGARAQEHVTAVANVDRNLITIGDPIKLTIVVDVADGYRVSPPPRLARFGELTVLDALPILQSAPSARTTRYQFRYFVTSFELGDHAAPAFEFEYSTPAGVTDQVRTTPLAIRVRSVIRAGEDTSDIKPLKPQLELPGTATSRLVYWGSLAAALLAVAIAIGVVVWIARRRRPRDVARDLTRTPAQLAIVELRRIAALDLPVKGRRDEHYELVARALRRYLAAQYGIPAEHRTARELYRDMERADIERHLGAAIHEILRESEAVRFQRASRHPRHAQQALDVALSALAKAAAAERPEIEVA